MQDLNERIYNSLITASRTLKRFEAELKEALAAGFPINYKDSVGNTLLLESVAAFQNLAARKLILAGADVDVQNSLGYTPLMLELRSGDPDKELVRLILERTKNINAQNKEYRTALGMFCEEYIKFGDDDDSFVDTWEIILLLLKSGADPYLDNKWLNITKDKLEKQRTKILKGYIEMFFEQGKNMQKCPQGYEYEI